MRLDPLRSFSRDVDRVPHSKIRTRLKNVLLEIESADRLSDVANAKKIQGHPHAHRIRIGDYRLGLFVQGNEVQLVRFLHRREVYRVFP